MDNSILLIHQIPAKIIEILQNSEEYCFIISPYFQSWNILDRELEKAAADNKKVIFIFRDDYNARLNFSYLNEDYNFDLVFVERLHTKLYLNERESLITSMNLYDSSKENNYEVGYYFETRQNSRHFKEKVIDNDILKGNVFILKGRYFEEIEQKRLDEKNREEERQRIRLEKQNTINSKIQTNRNYIEYGTCIRCGTRIHFDPEHPLCDNCYSIWSLFGNIYYQENYCLKCGERVDDFSRPISYANPICDSCCPRYSDGIDL